MRFTLIAYEEEERGVAKKEIIRMSIYLNQRMRFYSTYTRNRYETYVRKYTRNMYECSTLQKCTERTVFRIKRFPNIFNNPFL